MSADKGASRRTDADDRWFEDRILERFLRYVRIETTSDRHSGERPTTPGQLRLAELLRSELAELGMERTSLDENGFLLATIPSSPDAASGRSADRSAAPEAPTIGFMAHLDTSSDAPGANVDPRVHTDYDGGRITLEQGLFLDPGEFPELKRYRGGTVITSDGTTLLGADDKAGVAEIVTAAEYLLAHPEVPHGPVELILTPDEETGFGMDLFPLDRVNSSACYTLDGDGIGTMETECFEAYRVVARFHGRSIHMGYGRGKLVNAVEMASAYVNMLPKQESPQATDGRYGYYGPLEITGVVEQVRVELIVRDFEDRECRRRLAALRALAGTIEKLYPGGRVVLEETRQYANMRQTLKKHPEAVRNLERAIRAAGLEPVRKIIRGGTDGARLCEMGIPTPNVFDGGYNYHSRLEWAALPAMVLASRTVVELARLWGREVRR